jgi:hypothetical protein
MKTLIGALCLGVAALVATAQEPKPPARPEPKVP